MNALRTVIVALLFGTLAMMSAAPRALAAEPIAVLVTQLIDADYQQKAEIAIKLAASGSPRAPGCPRSAAIAGRSLPMAGLAQSGW